MPEKQKKVAVIVLQYGNSFDTIECLESLIKLKSRNLSIIVVDNHSPSKEKLPLNQWLAGLPSNKKKKAAFRGKARAYSVQNKELIYIENAVNSGFAGGNNTGLQFAMDSPEYGYFWFLNNDTTVDPDSLNRLVSCYEKRKKDRIGILGSKMRYYYRPEILQGIGGRMNPWFATSRGIGEGKKDSGQFDKGQHPIDFPIGASLFVSREFVNSVGMMTEDYFLYFEEMDWAIRARRKGFRVGYCPQSVVFHKEGGSIGSSVRGRSRSVLSDYYQLRNRIKFTARYRPVLLPTVLLGFAAVLFNRIIRGQWDRIPVVFKALFSLPYRK